MTDMLRITTLVLLAFAVAGAQQKPAPRFNLAAWNIPEPPLRIVGPIHYVGTSELGAYLFVTPAGHILLDGGIPASAPLIEKSIRALGFKPQDIRILLTSQAHFDHVGTMAYFQRLSKARVEVMRGDDRIVADGGKSDYLFGKDPDPTVRFEPVKVDRVLRDGDTVTLGDVTLTAKLTPGHTPGCTTWLTTVREGAKTYRVVFPGSVSVNPGTRLVDRPSYPGILEDYRRTLDILASLEPDIFLAAHASFFNLADKRTRASNDSAAEAFVDREGYRRLIAGRRAAFEEEVSRQKK
jgi:metallo-beta-lactamase class B